jgi:hypothetical protein
VFINGVKNYETGFSFTEESIDRGKEGLRLNLGHSNILKLWIYEKKAQLKS